MEVTNNPPPVEVRFALLPSLRHYVTDSSIEDLLVPQYSLRTYGYQETRTDRNGTRYLYYRELKWTWID